MYQFLHENLGKKLDSLPRSAILKDFQCQEYRFTIPKSRTRLAEKREEKEHMQLQGLLRFTQTQRVGKLYDFWRNFG